MKIEFFAFCDYIIIAQQTASVKCTYIYIVNPEYKTLRCIGNRTNTMPLKIRKSVKDISLPEIIYFESDEEFEDWAVAPYATIVEDESGKAWQGDHSDAYKEAIQQGKHFVIKDEDSKVYRRGCVCKLVSPSFQTPRETVLVQLPVDNLEDWSIENFRLKVLAKKQAKV